jgi:hypothetical protein
VVYRYGASREKPQWRWITWGAPSPPCYGSARPVCSPFTPATSGRDLRLARRDHRLHDLALVSAIVILLGAEIDADMEHQTARDTTEGSRLCADRRLRLRDAAAMGVIIRMFAPCGAVGPVCSAAIWTKDVLFGLRRWRFETGGSALAVRQWRLKS